MTSTLILLKRTLRLREVMGPKGIDLLSLLGSEHCVKLFLCITMSLLQHGGRFSWHWQHFALRKLKLSEVTTKPKCASFLVASDLGRHCRLLARQRPWRALCGDSTPHPQAGGHQWGHKRPRLHLGPHTQGKWEVVAESGREGAKTTGQRGRPRSQSPNTGEEETAGGWGWRYCVAMTVPFVLIKKDRRSELQLSHTGKC